MTKGGREKKRKEGRKKEGWEEGKEREREGRQPQSSFGRVLAQGRGEEGRHGREAGLGKVAHSCHETSSLSARKQIDS